MNIRQLALIVMLSVAFVADAWSAPAAPIDILLAQPDGTTFVARARGDEYASWTETLDGFSVVKVGDTWYYAESDNAGGLKATSDPVGSLSAAELRSKPLHIAPGPNSQADVQTDVRKIPLQSGKQAPGQAAVAQTQYVLTVLVNYSNVSFTYSDASFQTLMFGAANSVKDFFLDNSYGGFTIQPAAESYATANDGIIHVTRPVNHPNQGNTHATSKTEASAIVALTDTYVNYANYDANGDGYVSADELSIVIILAGYENSYGGVNALTPNVWGHKSSFNSALVLDGKSLQPYTMFGEAHASGNGSNKHQATIGIMCHELGHLMLALPDLYDIDAGNGDSEGIGRWGLMGGGSWNFTGSYSGDRPSHLSAWSKVATNFTVPADIDSNQNGVSFAKADANPVARRIWVDKYRIGEYFLVENRQKSGYDAGLPGAGLMIWHVDETKSSNADETHKKVDLEEADGLAQLDSNTNGGDTGDPFPGSSNKTTFNNTSNPNSKDYTGAATQIGVTSISASAATMTANISVRTGLGDHVRYDGGKVTSAIGFTNNPTAWLGMRALNDTLSSNFDGVDIFVNNGSGATIDLYYYSGMAGGTPSGLIHSQTGFSAGPGWNRLLLASPQSFPLGAERGVVLKVVNNSVSAPIVFNFTSSASGRTYYDFDGAGTFTPMCSGSFCGDVSMAALVSGSDTSNPTVTAITPAATGPTKASSVSFDISFSEDVVNFNNPNDVILTHSGTSHSGVSISGSGSSYTANVTGISGTGSFTLEMNIGSDVADTSGNPLNSSVTSVPVIIDNTPPIAGSITPAISGPTNANSVGFAVTFSENVVNFNNASDVTVTHSGTSHGGVSITGSGSSYTVNVTGITGDGSFTVKVNTGSDVLDTVGNSLSSSVTGTPVAIDNTPPAVTISAPSVTETTFGPVSYTVNYEGADAVTLSEGDITPMFTGTTTGDVAVSGSGTGTRTVTISNINGTGTMGISLAAGTASDTANNTAAAAGPSTTFSVALVELIFDDSFEPENP